MQHKQQYTHHSHSIHIGYHDKLTDTTQGHRPRSKREIHLIILHANINGIKNKLEELKLLIHHPHADIITIQETKLTPKAKTTKVRNFTTVRTDRLHKAGGGFITLIRDNITLTTGLILLKSVVMSYVNCGNYG